MATKIDGFISHREPLNSTSGGVTTMVDRAAKEGSVIVAVSENTPDKVGLGIGSHEVQDVNGRTQITTGVGTNYTHNYEGANGVIWPAKHDKPDQIGRIPDNWRGTNENVNAFLIRELFEGLGREGSKNIAVQDYQLQSLGTVWRNIIHGRKDDLAKVMSTWNMIFYSHIPETSKETLDALMERAEIKPFHPSQLPDVIRNHADRPDKQSLEKALAVWQNLRDTFSYHTAAFQTQREVDTLVEHATNTFDANVERIDDLVLVEHQIEIPKYRTLTTHTVLGAHPVGLDVDVIDDILATPVENYGEFRSGPTLMGNQLLDRIKHYKQEGYDVFVRFGRADYSKLWPENIEFARKFAEHAKLRGRKVKMLFMAQPTRGGLSEYDNEMERIVNAADEQNRIGYETLGYDFAELHQKGVERPLLFKAHQIANGTIDISGKAGFELTGLEAAYATAKTNGGFVVIGSESGLGITLKNKGVQSGESGIYITRNLREDSVIEAVNAYTAGFNSDKYRTGKDIIKFAVDNSVDTWEGALTGFIDKTREIHKEKGIRVELPQIT